MNNEENAILATRESAMLAQWARAFLRPTLEMTESFRTGVFCDYLHNLFKDCPSEKVSSAIEVLDSFYHDVAERNSEEVRLLFETDYNRLFVGPSRLFAPPYESFYMTEVGEDGRGRLRGPCEAEVLSLYREHGYTMPDEFVEYPDHIALELEYLSILAYQEAQAWETGDRLAALALEKDSDEFRKRHLGAWFQPFAEGVGQGAHYPFYPAMSVLVYETVLV